MSKLAKYLNRHVVGNVFDRPSILRKYSRDASILEIEPKLVAFPENTDDLRRLIGFANQLTMRGLSLPVTMRGRGHDKTGAAIGDGLVISTEQLNLIEEIDLRGRLVRVQPGVTLGELNSALHLYGLRLPVAAHPQMTLGGLIANYPTDDFAGQYGGISRFVERVEVVLSSGELAQFTNLGPHALTEKLAATSFEGGVYRQVNQLIEHDADAIINRSMRSFDSAGYANITRIRQGRNFNLLPLLFASQGTLAAITDIILHVESDASPARHLVAVLPDLKSLLRVLDFVIDLEPAKAQIYDLRLVQTAREYGKLPGMLENMPESGWLLLLGFDFFKLKTARRLQQAMSVLPPGTFAVEENAQNDEDFAELDAMLLSYLNDNENGERLPILDDVYIPSYQLIDYATQLGMLEQTLGQELPFYGSYLASNYQVRPLIDYTTLEGRRQSIDFLREYGQIVTDVQGSVTGGSPEGRVKTLAMVQSATDEEEKIYRELKTIFDPNNIMNPDVKLGADFRKILRNFRTTEQNGVVLP